ncbi:MAG: branched-chain amino acid ABC transporter permease [Desulfosoma sp.]
MTLAKYAATTAVAAALLLFPIIVKDPYLVGLMNFMILFGICCLGLNLVLGYTGLLSLGHAAFYGIGAYTTAILMTRHGFGFLPSLALSGGLTMAVALFLGIPIRKVRGDYFCLITIAFGEIFRLVALAWIGFTGGAMGIVGIPVPKVLGYPLRNETDFYYFGLLLLLLTYLTLHLLVHSRFGRALVAIREDELAAQSMGINTPLYMVLSFTIGSFYAGIAGSLLAVYQTTVTPSNFRLEESCLMIIMVIVGGMGRLWAPLVGVLIMTVATELFRPLDQYRMMIIGSIMIAVLLFRPQGLLGISSFGD